MKTKIDDPKPTTTPPLSISEFKSQLRKFILDCGFFRKRYQLKIESLQNKHAEIIPLYEEMIGGVTQQILDIKVKLQEAEQYEDYVEELSSLINNEITRQNKYLKGLKLQLSITKKLESLFALNTSNLFAEAQKDKATALLVLQTSALFAKLSDAQIGELIELHATDKDYELAKSLASALVAREYTIETAKVYDLLQQRVDTTSDKNFITSKENESIRKLLLKINAYLDKKIEESIKKQTQPWSLGYFGSQYKINEKGKKISIPQGIHELKMHLAQLDIIPPKRILLQLQTTLRAKQEEIHDQSFLQQIKRFVSYIFGYHRSQSTREEYQYLDDAVSLKARL